MSTQMIAPPHLRALLGAALCCGPVLASRAADAQANPAVAQSAAPCGVSWDNAAPPLLAAASPAGNGRSALKNTGAAALGTDITSSSDQLTTTAAGKTERTGNADVHVGEREIQADQLIYDRNNNSLNVSGRVRFHDPTVLVQGDTGRYGDDGALFNHAQFQLLQPPAATRHLANPRPRTAPGHRRRRGRRPRRDRGCAWHPDCVPALDLVSAERRAQERVPFP